jgi:hypothetical protein
LTRPSPSRATHCRDRRGVGALSPVYDPTAFLKTVPPTTFRGCRDEGDVQKAGTSDLAGLTSPSGEMLGDEDPDLGDAQFVPGLTDLQADNGVVHVIDKVLLPYDITFAEGGMLKVKGGPDAVIGSDGRDKIFLGNGNDAANGGAGSDMLRGDAGDDVLNGGEGKDNLAGGRGHDALAGDAGRDLLFGRHDDDHLSGGVGGDMLNGGLGRDVVLGNDGNDLLMGGRSGDIIAGGSGDDVPAAATAPTSSCSIPAMPDPVASRSRAATWSATSTSARATRWCSTCRASTRPRLRPSPPPTATRANSN